MSQGLVEAAQRGDRDAISALVDEFAPTVLGAAYGHCADWHLAADIAQESFATMVARIGDVREPAAFAGWLMAVVRSSAARVQRRAVPIAPVLDRPSEDLGPEAVVVRDDELRRVRLAVEALPEHVRLPIVLHYVAGSTVAEIADLCDVPVSTVKQRMRVARARLRDGMDEMAEETLCRLRPTGDDDPTDVIRMYTAMRSGDIERVAALLDARPDLVDVREDWTREDSFAHRLPIVGRGGGTPLLRAIERGDDAMVVLLLDRGADPNGACSCDTGETPLFTAVSHHRVAMVRALLDRGADPNATAFGGNTALHVAAIRGYTDIAEWLRAAGADPTIVDRGGRTAADWAVHAGTMWVTGIKAVDLYCPLPARGLVRWTPGYGLGSMVLLAELSKRALDAGRRVVWTGFVQSPTDEGDFAHGLAECGIADDVVLQVGGVDASDDEQVAAFERGLAQEADLLVIFEEVGRSSVIEATLPELARRACTTIVVGPLDGSATPPAPTGTPYLASVAFDVDRARRQQWPAIGPVGTWSRVVDDDGRTLGEQARVTPDRVDSYLTQAFFITEPFIAEPGEWVPLQELRSAVRALLHQR